MLFVKLLYLILLAGLTVFYVLYIDSLALILLICALILPVLLKIALIWLKLTTHVSLHSAFSSCTVNQTIPVSVRIETKCPLFFPKAHASVKVRHGFGKKEQPIRLQFPLHGKNITMLTFYVKAECCGMIQIKISKISVLDYFHLMHTNLKKQNAEMEILVLPKQIDLSLQETAESVYSPDSNIYDNRPGDDPSEIFNIREYHPGDAVSRIHWKLSSKSDKIFIREFGYPIEKQVLVIAEYLPNSAEGLAYMKQAQAFLTVLYSLTAELCQKSKLIFHLAWYDERQDRLIYQQISSTETLTDIFRELYHALRHMTLDTQILRDGLAGQQYSSVTLLTNDSSGELLPVLERQIEAAQKNLIMISSQKSALHSDTVTMHLISPELPEDALSGIII